MNNIKPGTRCEYRNAEHGQCKADAVRMVTVWEYACVQMPGETEPGDQVHYLPMCAACADWHEKHNK